MSPRELIATSLLLGAFALLGGIYGLLYGAGLLRGQRALLLAARLSYGLQCLAALAILLFTPLSAWWKLLVVMSCVAYLRIPPVTWRYLRQIHQTGGVERS